MGNQTTDRSETAGPQLSNDVHFLATRAGALGAAQANRDLAAVQLRVRSFSVLSIVCTASPQTQKEIAGVLLLDPSQVVTLLDDLESRALLRRIPDPDDRRARLVTATPAGQELYARAQAIVDESNRHALRYFDDDEVATLRALLQRLALGAPLDRATP